MIIDAATRLEKRKALTMEFGSSKKKRLQANFDRRIVKEVYCILYLFTSL